MPGSHDAFAAWIDGAKVRDSSAERFEVHDPSTGQPLATMEAARPALIDAAVRIRMLCTCGYSWMREERHSRTLAQLETVR